MRRAGFTLLEGLVVSFLVLLLLGVVGALTEWKANGAGLAAFHPDAVKAQSRERR